MTGSSADLFIPVILGTSRDGRMSEPVASFVTAQVSGRAGVESALIDVAELEIPLRASGGEVGDAGFTASMERADALVIVAPEYNHGYPGILKHALDTNLKEYIHKAVGICGVSAGPFGGTRVIENLLPVLRELGLVSIFWDVNFSNVAGIFDHRGALVDNAYVKRVEKFLDELIWMARVLRHGRRQIAGR